MTLASSVIAFERMAEDGHHLLIGPPTRSRSGFAPVRLATDTPLAAIIPLDQDAPIRIEAALDLWRHLAGRPARRPTDSLTRLKRERLAMMLRAFDGRGVGASRRDIAEVLFGRDRVPAGIEFDDHSIRSRTARLIREGLAMINGGYRALLRS